MEKEQYLKIKRDAFEKTFLYGIMTFNCMTYVIILLIMIEMYTVFPFILACIATAWMFYQFTRYYNAYSKIIRYEKKKRIKSKLKESV